MLAGMAGLVAIVGRPNVGKSALFNRIAGRRIAIVHDMPGVTRDRVTAEVEWKGVPFTLVDTGGIGLLRGEQSPDAITRAAVEQVTIAIEAADVIVLVVDVRDGVVPLDLEVAARLRESERPVLVAVNKSDTANMDDDAVDFSQLGFDELFSVSAIQARGIDPLMKRAMSFLPGEYSSRSQVKGAVQGGDLDVLKLAIVGRPNVGKSSIINALTNSDRVIVSDVPGTTRDAVDVPLEIDTEGYRQKYLLIDTAGLRKARRVNDSVEFFSTKRTEDAIDRADITVFVIDADTGIVEQDKKIADKIINTHKACVLVVNKWDLVAEDVEKAHKEEQRRRRSAKREDRNRREKMTSLEEFARWVQEKLFFLDYAPVIFTSAKSGYHLDQLLEAVRYVAAQLKQQIPTAILNRTIRDALDRKHPISSSGAFLKFFYAAQVKQAPPTFLLFMNKDEPFTEAYLKYLQKEMRKAFGYEGCPIILVPKSRPKKIEPIRTRKPGSKSQKSKVKRGKSGDKRLPARKKAVSGRKPRK
jgi:GTP-binding protein